ncbi:hypothetical protein P5P86_14235 [Nocardioides sp. BP30]|uniref:endonuclease/exonuclease/phosphatase family protein n=1 Tax=Nocardioides sp. BP30 TaxID=3036374 RepID=UPI0024695841|nr:endonuclease/exonuclease/phosphatase family protein [Nocardioides sp. BP30]WGL51116.1 hypothetical protein P5P86_14235 [Nocardioides sp. BP30]
MLTALLAVLPLTAAAEPAPTDDGTAPAPPPVVVPAQPAAAQPATTPRRTRVFFWMNALRSNHDRHARATAGSRMRTDIAHLRRADVDFGVLAETAPDQRRDFRRLGGSTWALVDGGNAIDNVVFYRRTAFTLLERGSLTIRYVHGQRIRLPIPVLADRVTGAKVAVMPVHNPRISAGPWRRISLDREVTRLRQLRRRHPDWQIVVAGDFNAEWTPACAFTRAGMSSLVATRQRCHRILPIDQMYATPGLRPHGYRAVHTTATDHHREYHAKLLL